MAAEFFEDAFEIVGELVEHGGELLPRLWAGFNRGAGWGGGFEGETRRMRRRGGTQRFLGGLLEERDEGVEDFFALVDQGSGGGGGIAHGVAGGVEGFLRGVFDEGFHGGADEAG